ncbi:MAG: hypothetical protein V1660_00705 [archaeon]
MEASEIIQQKKRPTAFKFKVSDLNRAEAIANGNNTIMEIDAKEIQKINLVANVIDKYVSEGEKKYAALTLDDSSSQIRAKSFGEDISKMQIIEIGDTVTIIGSLRFFNNEIYIIPDIIKRVEPEMLLLRKLEIERQQNSTATKNIQQTTTSQMQTGSRLSSQLRNLKPSKEEEGMIKNIVFNNKIELKQEKIMDIKKNSTGRDKIIAILKKNDEGIDKEKLIMSMDIPVGEIDSAIEEMLENAEIYEPKPGRIRIL